MKKTLIAFLQTVIVLVSVAVFFLLLWEPHLEGRNVHATLFEIYFKDSFLAYVYAAFIPFFIALYQVFNLLGYAAQNELFSLHSVKDLRVIQYCAITHASLMFGAVVYIFATQRGKDDIAGGVAMGLFVTFVSSVITVVAILFRKRIQNVLYAKMGK